MNSATDRCGFCSRSDTNLKRCTRCYLEYYCSKSCQSIHWPDHKSVCGRRGKKQSDARTSKNQPSREKNDSKTGRPVIEVMAESTHKSGREDKMKVPNAPVVKAERGKALKTQKETIDRKRKEEKVATENKASSADVPQAKPIDASKCPSATVPQNVQYVREEVHRAAVEVECAMMKEYGNGIRVKSPEEKQTDIITPADTKKEEPGESIHKLSPDKDTKLNVETLSVPKLDVLAEDFENNAIHEGEILENAKGEGEEEVIESIKHLFDNAHETATVITPVECGRDESVTRESSSKRRKQRNDAGGATERCTRCRITGCTQKCSRCKETFYCSRICQKTDWPLHKRICERKYTEEEKTIIEERQRDKKEAKERMDFGGNVQHIFSFDNFPAPSGRFFDMLTPEQALVNEVRPPGSLEKAVAIVHALHPLCEVIIDFADMPHEPMFSFQAVAMAMQPTVLVAFMFKYHEHVMRHGVYLKDACDSVTRVEFYLDHVFDNPGPYFSYSQVKPGGYICIRQPSWHFYMDSTLGIRIDNPQQVNIIDKKMLKQFTRFTEQFS